MRRPRRPHRFSPLGIAVTAAVLYAGLLVATASAQDHRLRVTLITGQTLVVTVDVPPGTPVSQVQIPGLPAPIKSIQDLGAIPTPTPIPTVKPTPTGGPSPSPSPSPSHGGGSPSGRSGGPGGSGKPGGGSKPTPGAHKKSGKNKKKKKGGGGNSNSGPNGSQGGGGKHAKKKKHRKKGGGGNGGAPSPSTPGFTVATPGPAKIGVPNFFIEKFSIPPFLLPIYQAAGTEYGVRWEILAAINEIETDYGRNLNTSAAGAVGWMQFLPSTWKTYGVDANNDGIKDPDNPADAIFAAARYLRAAGADKDIRKAIFAYNHANWYVDSVLLRASLIGGIPSNLIGSLTGLTEGRFPVDAKATYTDNLTSGQLNRKRRGNHALVVQGQSHRTGIDIFARAGAPVIAVNDARVVQLGDNARQGRFVVIQDVYGNTFTYSHLGSVVKRFAAPKLQPLSAKDVVQALRLPTRDPTPTTAASDLRKPTARAPQKSLVRKAVPRLKATRRAPRVAPVTKERLFAHPQRPVAAAAGGSRQARVTSRLAGTSGLLDLPRHQIRLQALRRGASIPAGTVLGRIGRNTVPNTAPHLYFEIRPAGRGAPRVDPGPILDGWKLLESTAIYRAKGQNPFFGPDAQPSIGQILLMSKDTLAQRLLADPRIQIYPCGRRDIQSGAIDRRVLATLEFLVASGFDPTISSLKCGHSLLTTSGNVSEHSSGDAVDIAAVNGIPITGHQGPGSITELVIQRLLTLQGPMEPHQIISLMTFQNAPNTLAMPDHYNHIHVGWKPMFGTNSKAVKQLDAILDPKQWVKLIDRLGQIQNPAVRQTPSRFAIPVTQVPLRLPNKGD